jgi:hypothetical protein
MPFLANIRQGTNTLAYRGTVAMTDVFFMKNALAMIGKWNSHILLLLQDNYCHYYT